MIGRQQITKAALGAAAALLCAMLLATPGPARANAEDGTFDGVPCNSLCQAYMAWSNRAMAATQPRPPSRPQERIAAHPKKPERLRHPVPGAHLASTTSAQRPRRHVAAPRYVEIPRLQTAALSDPVTATEQPVPATEAIAASPADLPAAATALPVAIPVALTAPVSTAQAPGDASAVSGGIDLQFAFSLVFALSLCAFLILMLLDRSTGRPQAAKSFR